MPLRQWYTPEYLNGASGGSISLSPKIDQTIRNVSQFAQLEWKNAKWSILLGARLDENSAVQGAILSPRATLRYNPTEQINLRATYAKGFRAPQVFDEDLHVGVVNGEAQRVTNAPNLKPEISHSYSISADTYFRLGHDLQLNLLVEAFYTRLLDVFTNNKVESKHGITYFERNNYGIDDDGRQVSSGAKITGVNLEGRLAYRWLQLQGGITLASNQYDAYQEWGTRHLIKGLEGQEAYEHYVPKADGSEFETRADDEGAAQVQSMKSKQMMRTPSVYGYFTLGLSPIKPLNISLTGTYTGAMWTPHAIVWGQGAAVSDRSAIARGLRKEGYEVGLVDAGGTALESVGAQWDELVRTPAFFDLWAKVSYDFPLFRKNHVHLFVGISNIFNAFQSDYDFGPDRDSAYIYGPTMPRSGYAGLKFSF